LSNVNKVNNLRSPFQIILEHELTGFCHRNKRRYFLWFVSLTGNPDSSEAIQQWGKHPSLRVGISPLLMTDLSNKLFNDRPI
jgi:hypothetical protein